MASTVSKPGTSTGAPETPWFPCNTARVSPAAHATRGQDLRIIMVLIADRAPMPSEPFQIDGLGGLLAERGDHGAEHGEALVLGRSPDKSSVNLLSDPGDLEKTENVVVQQIRDVAAGRVPVVID